MTDAQPAAHWHSAVAFIVATLLRACLIAGLSTGFGSAASARTLLVGPHRALKLPSQAALVARDGDHVVIDPGTYRDCAVWRASHLTIEGRGLGVTIADTLCFERGLFIALGQNITIRRITFRHGRSVYHNGAGILGMGANLTVEDSRFLGNENGILAGGGPNSRLRVIDSLFRGNGSCEGACAHGVYAGEPIALLYIEHCRFEDTRTAHHVKSRARTTIVIDSEISDGETGTSSYLIDVPNGGDVAIERNVLRKGVDSSNPGVAISIGEEKAMVQNPTRSLIVRANQFTNDLPQPTVFVRNMTPAAAELIDNRLIGSVIPLFGPGTVSRAARGRE